MQMSSGCHHLEILDFTSKGVLAHASLWEPLVLNSSQPIVLWHHLGSLKVAMMDRQIYIVEISKYCKQVFLFPLRVQVTSTLLLREISTSSCPSGTFYILLLPLSFSFYEWYHSSETWPLSLTYLALLYLNPIILRHDWVNTHRLLNVPFITK